MTTWLPFRARRARLDGALAVLVAVFAPGAQAPIHNHGRAVVGIYRGREKETWFRRVDDGSVPGQAQLEPEQTRISPPGTVTVVPDGIIHTVEAIDGQEAVSLHVYGTDIVTQERSTFDLASGTETPSTPRLQRPVRTERRADRTARRRPVSAVSPSPPGTCS
jgi:predicted metal-dependent enzyme (double-stranded beta helix superfamily)